MDLMGLKLFGALQGKMSWLEERQKLLAENVANANTPGYRARDVKGIRFADALSRTQAGAAAAAKVAVTHPGHLKPPSERRGGAVYEVRSLDTTQNGNAVTLEQEMVKLADNQLDHSTVTNLYRKHIGMLRMALGRNSR